MFKRKWSESFLSRWREGQISEMKRSDLVWSDQNQSSDRYSRMVNHAYSGRKPRKQCGAFLTVNSPTWLKEEERYVLAFTGDESVSRQSSKMIIWSSYSKLRQVLERVVEKLCLCVQKSWSLHHYCTLTGHCCLNLCSVVLFKLRSHCCLKKLAWK